MTKQQQAVPITQENIRDAAQAGVEILSPGSTVSVPAGSMDRLILLRHLLSGVAAGQLMIVSPAPPADDKPADGKPAKKNGARQTTGRQRSAKR